MRRSRGIKYRKFESNGGRYVGRVHLQYYERESKVWKFVCPKPSGSEWTVFGEVVDDGEVVTCRLCVRHAPDIVELMDEVPSLDEFQ